MLDSAGHDAGALTPAAQDRVVDECFQCRRCRTNCPYVPGAHELAIDFPRLMARARAMRHATGGRTVAATVADQLLGRTDTLGRIATRGAPVVNRIVGVAPGTVRRRLLARLTGITAVRPLPPYARRRFSRSVRLRPHTAEHEFDRRVDRRVTVFPTCLVEYRRPEIGAALVEVFAHHRIGCDIARAGCSGAPWLTSGDTRRFKARASRTVATLAAAIRAGTDIVVAQPTCHAVITTDYVDHVGGPDAELVAGRTFDAVQFLSDHTVGHGNHPVLGQTLAGKRVAHHEPCSVLGDESPSAARQLLERAGATVIDVRRSTGVDPRWGLRVANEGISLAIAHELGAEIKRLRADTVTGTCVLTNTSLAEQTGRSVTHPFELLGQGSEIDRP